MTLILHISSFFFRVYDFVHEVYKMYKQSRLYKNKTRSPSFWRLGTTMPVWVKVDNGLFNSSLSENSVLTRLVYLQQKSRLR